VLDFAWLVCEDKVQSIVQVWSGDVEAMLGEAKFIHHVDKGL
jgi:hypothetical protein